MTQDLRRSRVTRWDVSLIMASMGVAGVASGVASALGLSPDLASSTGIAVALGAFVGLVGETGLSYLLIKVARKLADENDRRVNDLDRTIRRLRGSSAPDAPARSGASQRFRVILFVSSGLMVVGFVLWILASVIFVQSLSGILTGLSLWNVPLWLSVATVLLGVVGQLAFLLPALDVRIRLIRVARLVDALENGDMPAGLRRTSVELRQAERRPRARPFGPFRFPTWRGGLPVT